MERGHAAASQTTAICEDTEFSVTGSGRSQGDPGWTGAAGLPWNLTNVHNAARPGKFWLVYRPVTVAARKSTPVSTPQGTATPGGLATGCRSRAAASARYVARTCQAVPPSR